MICTFIVLYATCEIYLEVYELIFVGPRLHSRSHPCRTVSQPTFCWFVLLSVYASHGQRVIQEVHSTSEVLKHVFVSMIHPLASNPSDIQKRISNSLATQNKNKKTVKAHNLCRPTLSKGSKWHVPSTCKSELLMFSYFTQCALLPGQILCINTHPAKRYVK